MRILQCIFCAGLDLIIEQEDRIDLGVTSTSYKVECCLCGASGPKSSSENAAIKGWNAPIEMLLRKEKRSE